MQDSRNLCPGESLSFRRTLLSTRRHAAVQDIAAKENERTRAEVQVAAAHKALAKLRKDAAKGEADRNKHAADIEAMKNTFKVDSSAMPISFMEICRQIPSPHVHHIIMPETCSIQTDLSTSVGFL